MSQLVPLVLAVASPHSKDNLCFWKLAKLEEVFSKTQLKLRSFSKFLRCSHMTQLVPPACRGRGAPGQAPHSRDKTNSLMNCHHHNHQYLANFHILHRKKRGSKQRFRSEYLVHCDISNLNIFPFQVYNLNECDLISSQDDQYLGCTQYIITRIN